MPKDSIDTNLIIRLITGAPTSQSHLAWQFLANSDSLHHLSIIALSETTYVLEKIYHYSRNSIITKLTDFLSTFDAVLEYDHTLINLTLPYYQAHPSLSFNDCLLAFDAELTHSEPLFTFDQKLSRQHPSAAHL